MIPDIRSAILSQHVTQCGETVQNHPPSTNCSQSHHHVMFRPTIQPTTVLGPLVNAFTDRDGAASTSVSPSVPLTISWTRSYSSCLRDPENGSVSTMWPPLLCREKKKTKFQECDKQVQHPLKLSTMHVSLCMFIFELERKKFTFQESLHVHETTSFFFHVVL